MTTAADTTSAAPAPISVPAGYRPLLVRAHLVAGIAHASSWGIALDSLLAAQLWANRKHELRAAGVATPTLHETETPEDLELPLARCASAAGDAETEGLWHWAATTAYPEGRPSGLPPDIHMWSGRVDHRAVENLTPGLPSVVSDRQGRYRARRMPLLVTVCSAVTWSCIGDPGAIAELLAGIGAIGKKRSHGEGEVLRWEITNLDPTIDTLGAAHLHPDGTLGRPTPATCLVGRDVVDGGCGTAGLRPPYMHRARQHSLQLPVSLDHQEEW